MKTVEIVGKLLHEYLEGKYVLETACGAAEFSIMASSIATKVVCTDIDDSRLLTDVGQIENLQFQKMDATKMIFPDNAFDAVIAYNAIGHLSGIIREVIHESNRVLKDDGVFLVISNWKLDKAVITEELIPFLDTSGADYSIQSKGKTTWVIIRKLESLVG